MCKDEENSAETHHNIRAEVTCSPSLLIYPGNFLSYKNNNNNNKKKTRQQDISRSILKVSSRAYKKHNSHKIHIL